MSCILRVSGKTLDIDTLRSSVSLTPYRTWRAGEPRGMLAKRLHADSGACFLVGNADFCDFDKKVAEATDFLKSSLAWVTKLASFPGIEQATLDFALASTGDKAAVFSYLPPVLVRLAAQAGLGIEISYYVCERTSQVQKMGSEFRMR